MRNMKCSNLNWIDEIPNTWDVQPLKANFIFNKGLSVSKSDLTDEGIDIISYGQVHAKENDGVSIKDNLIRHVSPDFADSSARAHYGDFIFADTSEDIAGCGNCVFVDKEAEIYAGYHTILLKAREEKDNKFLGYLFSTNIWRQQIVKLAGAVKVYSITQSILNQVSVIVPPMEEQKQITSYLDEKCGKIDEAIERHKAIIASLEEYKESIIHNAVTGKIDCTEEQ